jgi:hypothetical protein
MEQTTETSQSLHPVSVIIPHQPKYSRLLALATLLFGFIKMILLIPHFFVLWLITIVAFLAGVIAQFAVLFTGRYPQSIFNFVSGTLRWHTRVYAYFYGLSDKYPPFHLSE